MDYLTLDIFGNNRSRSEAVLSLTVKIFPSWWPITGSSYLSIAPLPPLAQVTKCLGTSLRLCPVDFQCMDYLTLDIFGNNSSRSEAALSLAVIIFPSWWPITGERINLLTIIGT